jgi:hypothetical protein
MTREDEIGMKSSAPGDSRGAGDFLYPLYFRCLKLSPNSATSRSSALLFRQRRVVILFLELENVLGILDRHPSFSVPSIELFEISRDSTVPLCDFVNFQLQVRRLIVKCLCLSRAFEIHPLHTASISTSF